MSVELWTIHTKGKGGIIHLYLCILGCIHTSNRRHFREYPRTENCCTFPVLLTCRLRYSFSQWMNSRISSPTSFYKEAGGIVPAGEMACLHQRRSRCAVSPLYSIYYFKRNVYFKSCNDSTVIGARANQATSGSINCNKCWICFDTFTLTQTFDVSLISLLNICHPIYGPPKVI